MEVVDGTTTVDDVGAFVAELEGIGDTYGATIQAFDARYVVDRAHVERAVELATRARDRGEGIAEDFGVEILLYAAGRRQINQALEMGLSDGDCPVVAVVVGGDEAAAAAALGDLLDPGETLGEYDRDRVRSFFDVTDTELAATEGTIADAVHERVALLPVEK
ncbi:KEOPS complex subunit Cgi121 [Halomicroarcula sp. GCM10025709]|uniref:KEOPS complex subunit Cgi121 n=1 Tax=Haloarcula TaxID=2237 RepID=UPI0024C2183E|nr:KEOPS complex subunit Cgi121 [Halomicroarcula sp. YJ-61-S]